MMDHTTVSLTLSEHLDPIYGLIQDVVLAAAADSLQIVYANPAALSLLGLSPAEMISRTLVDIVDLSPGPEVCDILPQLNATPTTHPGRLAITYSQQVPATITFASHTLAGHHLVLCSAHLTPPSALEQLAAQQALVHSEARYRMLVEGIPDLIFRIRRDGTIIDHEESAMGLLYPPEEFLNRHISESTPPHIAHQFLKAMHACLAENRTESFEYQLRADEDSPLLDYEARIIPHPNAVFDEVLVLVRDITEQVQAQREQEKLHARYRALIRATADLIFLLNYEGVYQDFHIPAELGLPQPPDLIGKSMYEALPEAVAAVAYDKLNMVIRTGTLQSFDYALPEVDGTTHYYECRFVKAGDNEIHAIVRDITFRKQAEEALKRSEETARTLLNTPFYGALLVNLKWEILAINQRLADLIGRTPEDLTGTSVLDVDFPDKISRVTEYQDHAAAVITTGEPVTFNTIFRDREFENSIFPMRENGVITRLAVFTYDITRQRRDERQLRRQAALLQGVAQAANQLLMPGDLYTSIQQALDIAGAAAGVSYAALFTVSTEAESDRPTVSVEYVWNDDNVAPVEALTSGFKNIPWATTGLQRWYHILARGEVFNEPLATLPPDERERLHAIPSKSLLLVPIMPDGDLWGFVGFDDIEQPRVWDDDVVSVLQTLAASMSAAIQRHAAEQELEHKRDIATTLREIGTVLNSTLNLPDVMQRLLDEIQRVVPYEGANILFLQDGAAQIVYTNGYETHDTDPEELLSVRFDLARAVLLQTIIDTREPVICGRVKEDRRWIKLGMTNWIESWLGAPIIMRDQTVRGFFSLDSSIPDFYTDEQARFVKQIGQQAAIAIENAQLYQRLQDQYDRAAQLHRASEHILATLNLDEIIDRFTTTLTVLAPAATSIVCENRNENKTASVQRIATGAALSDNADLTLAERVPPGTTFSIGSPDIQALMTARQHTILSETLLAEHFSPLVAGQTGRVILIPLALQEQVFGFTLVVECTTASPLSSEECQILVSLAQQTTVAIGQARLFAEIKSLEAQKSDMIQIASHDLRGPLARVKGYLSHLLYEKTLTFSQREHLALAQRAISDMQQIVADILSLDRIHDQQRDSQPVHWCELIDQAVAALAAESTEQNHTVTVDCSPNTPITTGDPPRLQQAIVNLLSNAIKYTPPGGRIEARAFLKYYGGKPFVWIEVEDNGIGIPETQQPNLFQPFFRAHHAEADAIPGMGLGLSTVKRTVNHHRGKVYFTSTPGEGSTFGFRLPVLDD